MLDAAGMIHEGRQTVRNGEMSDITGVGGDTEITQSKDFNDLDHSPFRLTRRSQPFIRYPYQ